MKRESNYERFISFIEKATLGFIITLWALITISVLINFIYHTFKFAFTIHF